MQHLTVITAGERVTACHRSRPAQSRTTSPWTKPASASTTRTPVIPVSPPNHSGFGWKRIWFSLGADYADVRIKVAVHNGTSWTTTNYDVLAGSPRVGFEVATGTTKLSIGRVKKTATDTNDNSPFSWLLESQA
ncbi:hypothetical protein [Streptomyces silvisoli]|uniref:F5/8 type C domain-containing protein n=1 Tax=Streptomyces silvisoli TaxID=3034235 RepID=A0ABT5ZWX7_9ACTN|nr:hypothetical protein [Streptomyces silvisoli]MDF3294327.1 hypothetical protein [Streptomyces silvisoli]